MQTHGNQRETNRAGLADADVAAEFLHIKNGYAQKVPGADEVVVGPGPQTRGQFANVVVDLLRRLENGRCAAGLRTTGGRKEWRCYDHPRNNIQQRLT